MTAEEIQSKLAILRDNLEKLEALPAGTYDEFVADFRTVDSALHRLQTSIQVLIDVGSFVVAELGLGAPSTSRGVLEVLEEHGSLPQGAAARFGPIFGFRNRVVHLYDRVDPKIVYRLLIERREDLAELADLLTGALETGR
ncbi:MAG: type VII toxin-antitoxin system HepT family RNase toxin [Myxococcota bacterium]